MIIDSHFHFGLKGYNSSRAIKDYLKKNDIDKLVLLSWEELSPVIPSLYKHLSIEDIWLIYNELPDKIIPFYAPDPTETNALEKFKYWYNKGIRGFGELKVTINWDDPRLSNILKFLNSESLPLVFHMQKPHVFRVPGSNQKVTKLLSKYTSKNKWKGVPSNVLNHLAKYSNGLKEQIEKSTLFLKHPGYMMGIKELEHVLIKYPNIKFIGHGPFFWESFFEYPIATNPRNASYKGNEGSTYSLLKNHENLFADLSGPSGFTLFNNKSINIVEQILEELNRKMLFGTDNYDYNILSQIKQLNITQSSKANILGLNFKKLIL